jgi:hypothetical protein
VKQNGVYDAFKKRVDKPPRELIEDLKYYSDLYLSIRRPETVDKTWLQQALSQKQYLDIGTADPLILNLLDRWKSGTLGKAELQKIFRGLESFAIRRSICNYSTRGYYQIFPHTIKSIDDSRVANSVFDYLAGRGWPEDEEFRESFVTFDLYSREADKCRLIFERLQRDYGHKEPIELDELQIEHVMPQELGDGEHGDAWKAILGNDWEETHAQWKHTPGNLTLTGYNPELSNRRFSEKQELFAESKLDLNDHFLEVDEWSAIEIRDRGESLSRRVAELWPVPDGVAEDSGSDGTYQITLLDEGVPIVECEDSNQNQVMADVVEYLIDEASLLDKISLPYLPGTGDGDRALLHWKPHHADGAGMTRHVELSNGSYIFTKLSSNEKQRYLRELARICDLVCRFDGRWPA